jgi:hypothetical protein
MWLIKIKGIKQDPKKRTFLIMVGTHSLLQKEPDIPETILTQNTLGFILVHHRNLRQIDTFP